MGMAASQARFLGLTARKTNVEYEGQQVNQQRTVLANESSGLFNQMLALKVPTPPSSSDFYNTRYVFDSMGQDFSIINYNASGGAGVYNITLQYEDVDHKAFSSKPIEAGSTIKFVNGVPTSITLLAATEDDNGNKSVPISPATNEDDLANIEYIRAGKGITAAEDKAAYYKYTSNVKGDNRTYYISSDDFKDVEIKNGDYTGGLTQYYIADATTKKTVDATASFESTSDGRYSKVTIGTVNTTDPDLEKRLKGTYDLDLTQVNDEEGYEEAMKDYTYQKDLYERAIQDINAKTEIIQKQDRTLELRLKQLDTEQEALKTEMDAVKEVIQKNVESTFKTFA